MVALIFANYVAGAPIFALPAYVPLAYLVARTSVRRDYWENVWRAILLLGIPSWLVMWVLLILGAGTEGMLPFVFVGLFVLISGAGIGGWAMTEVMYPELEGM